MSTFRFLDDFAEHKEYVKLLKKALQQVKGDVPRKFLYFKKYPFGAQKYPLVLVDYDMNCVGLLTKAGHRPTDEGLISLTPQDELNFEPKKGALKRIRIKKYFEKMGGGIKPVFVPAGEVDDEGEEEPTQSVPGAAPVPPTATAPPSTPPPTPPKPGSAPVPPGVQPDALKGSPPPAPTPPPNNEAMDKFTARFRGMQADLKTAVATAGPAGQDLLKMARDAGDAAKSGDFKKANELLDALQAKIKAPKATPPPIPPKPSVTPPTPPKATPPPVPPKPKVSPKLSTYLNMVKEWNTAKAAARTGAEALEAAIGNACDPELKSIVDGKLVALSRLPDLLEDEMVNRIQDAGREADDERQAEKNTVLVKSANALLEKIRKDSLASVVDNNPFGRFAIAAPMENILLKITNEFKA